MNAIFSTISTLVASGKFEKNLVDKTGLEKNSRRRRWTPCVRRERLVSDLANQK